MEDILASTPPEALDAMLAGTTATVLAGGHTHIQQMNFSKCELPHTPRPIPERRWRAWADGLSICEMSVYQEAILVAEGT
jgi:hypothetical protein